MHEVAEELTARVADTLEHNQERLARQFSEPAGAVGTRHAFVDDLLPRELVLRIHQAFPPTDQMRLLNSFRERKYTTKDFDRFDPILRHITFAVQQPRIIRLVEAITGIAEQQADPTLYAGGLSAMGRGHFLNPHIDNSHDGQRKNYRTVNLLFYVSPDWRDEDGGHLELWDRAVKERVVLHSRFNRLAIMETNPWAWHSVCAVAADRLRCCVSNYYFSPRSPLGTDYFHVTEFAGRPEEPLKRMVSALDNVVRSGIRRIVKGGLGRQDTYRGTS